MSSGEVPCLTQSASGCFVEVRSLGDISQVYTECQIAHGNRVINIQGMFVTVSETVSAQ